MPEMRFAVVWPDGAVESYYSPSLVVHDFLAVGDRLTPREFVEKTSTAMDLASERVRAKFGVACTSAMATKEQIAVAAARHGDGSVVVLRMAPGLEGAPA